MQYQVHVCACNFEPSYTSWASSSKLSMVVMRNFKQNTYSMGKTSTHKSEILIKSWLDMNEYSQELQSSFICDFYIIVHFWHYKFSIAM